MRVSPCVLPQRAVAALCLAVVLLLCSSPTRGGVQAVRSLQIASPLQALTLWDAPVATPRSRFLPRFAKALQAEHDARAAATTVAEDAAVPPDNSSSNHNNNWAQQAAAADRSRARQAEVKAGAAFEHAFRAADAEDDASVTATTTLPPPRSATYQLVGVVQQQQQHSQGNAAPPGHDPAICWYARPKAADATWSVRLVHVNRQAIVYDLFTRGKVDVLAKFRNRGCFLQSAPPDESASSSSSSSTTAAATTVTSSVPLVEAEYTVRERSWKTLWNFSPKHVLTDSGGMYWRERRLRPGLYTDGTSVYESSYRYSDGRNGMHRKSSLPQFLQSAAVPTQQKGRIMERLEHDTPDLVLEE